MFKENLDLKSLRTFIINHKRPILLASGKSILLCLKIVDY
jgi:hypothetical protein